MYKPGQIIGSGTDAVVLVPARDARLIDRMIGRERINLRGQDAQLDGTLANLHAAGEMWAVTRHVAPPAVPFPEGSAETDSEDPLAESPVLVTTREAAEVLGVSTRRVRQLAAAGILPPATGRHPYQFNREDVEFLAESRGAA